MLTAAAITVAAIHGNVRLLISVGFICALLASFARPGTGSPRIRAPQLATRDRSVRAHSRSLSALATKWAKAGANRSAASMKTESHWIPAEVYPERSRGTGTALRA